MTNRFAHAGRFVQRVWGATLLDSSAEALDREQPIMKQVNIHGADRVEIDEVPEPTPGPRDAVIRASSRLDHR
jgi:hypothetical protein